MADAANSDWWFGQLRHAILTTKLPVGGTDMLASQFHRRVSLKRCAMWTYVIAIGVAVGVTAPALAAEYYVIRGPDKKCKVVETKPVDNTIVVIGDKAYITREEAESHLTVVCKEK
jgi:hypothetical protein